MAILKSVKKGAMLLILFFLFSLSSESQTFTEIRDAFQKSYIDEATGNYTEAAKSLRNIYSEQSYEINLRLGWLTYLTGSFTESRAYYSRAITLMPYSVESRFGYVYPAAAMGNWSEVIEQYEKILEITPNNSVAMHRLGLIYYGREDYTNAMKYFQKVVNLYPFDYDALSMLAWTNYRAGNLREARVLFQKALLNTPNGSSALEGLDLLK
ncbi:MAG: tetratricopeptide repeat protein [Bacteroidales bacterium]|nr:tetratricopeptide repeat protein [Bacteroidales bacterium]